MKQKLLPLLPALLLALCMTAGPVTQAAAQTRYPLSPDSLPQPGVPKGEVLHFTFEKSRIFPGTFRDYWIYVPAQYSPEKPACLYVNQDGLQWNAPVVFDNLIAKGEMPVTIGVFVTPGRVRARDEKQALDRFNRSLEYDGLGDEYARFLLEELLPDVETKKASDGRAIRLSHSGNDHAIGGASSGAVCAFTAAWERPDQFSRVFSAIGTYVGLRGADAYPTLIRKYEPKPIRVFLQDGSNDQNIYGGDWWMANQMMERALTFSGYEVEHAWGDGGHNGEQGTAVFPDAMRWLWKGWPAPVKGNPTRNDTLNALLLSGEGWQPVGSAITAARGLAANSAGEVFTTDAESGKAFRIAVDSGVSQIALNGKPNAVQVFGPDGLRYRLGQGRLTVTGMNGYETALGNGFHSGDLVVRGNRDLYLVSRDASNPHSHNVWLFRNGKKQLVDADLPGGSGITLSPDQTLLYVADGGTHWVYSYQIQPDGALAHRQRYYWLHSPDSGAALAGGMCVDRDGRLYVATALGVQVCDQAGRVNCILPTPGVGPSNVCFGGKAGATLYANCGGRIYRRKLKVRGAPAWRNPVKPAAPRL